MAGARSSFILDGHSEPLDLRIDAVRPDLADVALAKCHFAPHYAEAMPRGCSAAFAPLCASPSGDQTSELIQGETFMVLDLSGGWAWGYCGHDHYVGYVEESALGEFDQRTEMLADDAVTAAEGFLGMAYLLGGRGGAGIDCSGLVQRSLAAIGISAPRDSDMQLELGTPINELGRNDLVSFEGHIGLMVDGERLIHATGHHGVVLIEPLADVAARTPIIARKRLP